MLDSFEELGSAPYEEECAQVGTDRYKWRAKKECWEYRRQLLRMFPEVDAVELKVAGINSGEGKVYQVVVKYDSRDGNSIDAAHHILNNVPAKWDDEAAAIIKIAKEMGDNA